MKVLRPASHVSRYLMGALISWVVYPLEAAVVAVAALAAAIISGNEPSGPTAGPTMIFLAALAGAGLTALVTMPAVALGEAIARRRGWLAAFGVATGAAAVLLSVAVWLWNLVVARVSAADGMRTWALVAVLAVAPFLVLLVMTYGYKAVLAAARQLRPRSRGRLAVE